MSDSSSNQGRSRKSDRVGYGHPPEHSRWKRGQSGNPKGRPPRAPPISIDEVIGRAFGRLVDVTTLDGGVETMTKLQVAMERLATSAAQGDRHALRTLVASLRFTSFVGELPPIAKDQTRDENAKEIERLRAEKRELEQLRREEKRLPHEMDEEAEEDE